MKFFAEQRGEVMKHIEQFVLDNIFTYLKQVEENWHPSDFLPDTQNSSFIADLKDLQSSARELPYDLIAVLIGDTITEEALPTYETWLSQISGVSKEHNGGWNKWLRYWTAEENRHGDLLNKYLYLSGRVNMKQLEISTQYLLADGMEIGTGTDPYRNFIYTSFQETATNISHRRVASLAKANGDPTLAKMCAVIAADEARHAKAYKTFVSKILEVDTSEMLVAFEAMMRNKIVMPAHFLREAGVKMGETFDHFSDAAQRLGIYTSADYIQILVDFIEEWKVDSLTDLTDSGEKARDYLMALPDRLTRIAQRIKTPELQYKFSWITA